MVLRRLAICVVALVAYAPALWAAVPAPIDAFVQNHCIDCHDNDARKGGLSFDGLAFGGDEASHARWVRVYDQVLSGEMPPKKKPQPDEAGKRDFLTLLGQDLTSQHAAMKGTVLRRLNRTEYENTLRDLLGMRVEVRDLLPEDALSHGFDNVGEALGMSDVQLARYMDAAEHALDTALQRVTRPESTTTTHDYKDRTERAAMWKLLADGTVVFFNNGIEPDTQLRSFRAPFEGNYRVRITGYAYQAQEPVAFAVHSGPNGKVPTELVGYYELAPGAPQTLMVETWLRANETIKISPAIKLGNDAFKKAGGRESYPGPGLAVKGVEIEGPIYEVWPPRAVTLLFGDLAKDAKEWAPPPPDPKAKKKKREPEPAMRPMIEVASADPDADAGRLLRGFASAAFRRPVDDAKVAPYVALCQAELKRGSNFSVAMRTAAIAMLCAPDFLYLREPVGKLDDYALAARLSYFLSRSAPDEHLLRTAAAGKLRDPTTLRAETDRLLAHPNAARFAADFTDAWLNLRDIGFTTPDKTLYPEFDSQLQDAMLAESRGFFRELINSNLAPSNIIASDFAMVNRRLAEHYGIAGVNGVAVQKVKLPADSKRNGGVLTQAAVLKVSANGTNTSPVVRGVWVLERVLGQPPQPPPPNVPGLEPDVRGATTLRQQLEKHRELASCNSCHAVIDPPGFALESYDVIGGWRERFRSARKQHGKINLNSGPPVDASGELADGTKFTGFADFQKLLLAKPDQVTKCITEKLLVFSSGRELGFSDRAEVSRIVAELNAKNGGMRDLVHLVVGSQIFQVE